MSLGDRLYQHYDENQDYQSIVYFKGKLSQEILGELGSMIKSSYSKQSNIKRIFAVFIELAQNILHYSEERVANSDGSDSGVGIVMVNEEDSFFHISSGNLIDNSKIDKLKSKCEQVNSLTGEQLKELYKKRIKQSRPEDSKGAGLGFIDMARKSDSPIEYTIKRIDEQNSFFTLS
ncbi:MAG: SiaB family protein kinase, partial [Spirochaetota bacterium]